MNLVLHEGFRREKERKVIRAMQDSIGAHEDAVDRETEEESIGFPSPGFMSSSTEEEIAVNITHIVPPEFTYTLASSVLDNGRFVTAEDVKGCTVVSPPQIYFHPPPEENP
jgi:hypothetical protein